MPVSPEDIVRTYIDDGSSVERNKHRKHPLKLSIVEPNPAWSQRFQETKTKIETALGSEVVQAIHHAGSTSVPNLPAKDIIDIDLVVTNIHDEDAYVGPLESLGFSFLFREPAWHQHRFFVDEADRPGSYHVNLHVFGPDCPEVEKHRIFREWLTAHPEDVSLYARVKRECAEASTAAGESMQDYTRRKEKTISDILDKAYRYLGYIK